MRERVARRGAEPRLSALPGRIRIVWTFAVSLAALVVLMLSTGGIGRKELRIALAWIAFVVLVTSRIRAGQG